MVAVIAVVVVLIAVGPAVLFAVNLGLYRRPPAFAPSVTAVSILIPARDEERSIAAAIDSALASRGVDFEIIVLDDHSIDQTRKIVGEYAARDGRVRLHESKSLPDGWCGKQFACHQLAAAATHEFLLFLDADVRLEPDAVARFAAFREATNAELVSGVPWQQTGTLLEKLLIPLIHFLLLGYLPLAVMRRQRRPSLGAGCGQLFLARRDAYRRAGGHEAIRGSRHDGITLPRAFRRAGFHTDLCDVTDLATCRMYRSSAETWRGLSKNATEGMASPTAIVPWTVILLGGQVAPWALLPFEPIAAAVAISAGYFMRLTAAIRFRQSWLSAVLHPLGIALLVAIQWYALARSILGRPVEWKGRGPVRE